MLWVGVDDTDSRHGGCTTALASELVDLFPHLTPRGTPRLVRLNPNVPWKTRGNGAIALAFDGDIGLDDALARIDTLVAARARRDEGTSPGFVAAHRQPDAAFYDATVTRVVTRGEAERALADAGAVWAGGRGVIGAAAAIAWPGTRSTWERIAYREPARIGTQRDISASRLREVEEKFGTLFDSYDLVEDTPVCIPASPCPVLYGLRGTHPGDLEDAARRVGPEPELCSTLFLTNQGTDDHIRARTIVEARPLESSRVRGRIVERPSEKGGHVFATVEDGTGALRCAAYAQTADLRHVVASFRAGDEITVMGGVHAGPDGALTLGIEKLCVHHTAPRKTANPACPQCGRGMKSAGRDAGYRCRACGTRAEHAPTSQAPVALGWVEAPSSARRHLARPLKLGAPQDMADVTMASTLNG